MAPLQSKECDSCLFKINSLEEPFPFKGKWLFTREDRKENKDIGINTDSWKKLKTPGPWKKAYGDGKIFDTGWYRGEIEFADNLIGQKVVFLVDTYMGETNFYLDGKSIYNRTGTNSHDRFYAVQAIPIKFTITKKRHLVAFRVKTILMTGVYQLPFQLRKYKKSDFILALMHIYGGELKGFFGFILLAAGLFFMLIFIKTKNNFYFIPGLVGIVTFPFFFFTMDFFLKVFDPRKAFILHYVGLSFMALMHYKFVQYFKSLPKIFEKIYTVLFVVNGLVFLYLSFDFNLKLFQINRSLLFGVAFIVSAKITYLTFKAMKEGVKGGSIFFYGESFFVACVFNDLLNALGVTQSIGVLYMGMGVSTFAIVMIAVNNFADTYIQNRNLLVDLKALNDSLEEKVKERTRELAEKNEDINTMLHNLPQGVLTVVKGTTIHKEYSSHLEEIFETKDITDRNAIEFIFGNSTLSSDQVSQVNTTVENFIGEDMLNYEVNEDLLMKEICVKNPNSGSEKYLELLWSPIHSIEDDDTLEKILVCIRDITKLKALTAESEEQKKKIEMIGQLIQVLPDDFGEFVNSANKYIKENVGLIKEKGEIPPIEIMEQLFRNMHTIKGNARTHDFVYVSNAAHEAEQEYDQLRKGLKKEWDPSLLIFHLEELEEALGIYQDVHDNVLGRGNEGEEGGSSDYIRTEISGVIEIVDKLMNNSDKERASNIENITNKLVGLASVSLSDVLKSLIKSLDSLAYDLDKETPEVVLEDKGMIFHPSRVSATKDVFTHILRNSIDHGIEEIEERKEKGKPDKGEIKIRGYEKDGFNYMIVKDDGRGLNLAKIAEKAKEMSGGKDIDSLKPIELANFVFLSGISTAKVVTDVSGRGVGMDAVKAFLMEMGGNIEIKFQTEPEKGQIMVPFSWVIKIPNDFSPKFKELRESA
jgi:HPt (histidine-containing phosphotransfer) domain-containing protein